MLDHPHAEQQPAEHVFCHCLGRGHVQVVPSGAVILVWLDVQQWQLDSWLLRLARMAGVGAGFAVWLESLAQKAGAAADPAASLSHLVQQSDAAAADVW